jgi:hypothetical protein
MMFETSLPILQKFQQLVHVHGHSKVDHKKFQPNEENQRKLIIHGAAHRMVYLAAKREQTKYLYAQRLKQEEEKKKTMQADILKENEERNPLSSSTNYAHAQSFHLNSQFSRKASNQNISAFRDSMDLNSKTAAFAHTLKTCRDSNRIVTELSSLAHDLTADSKKVFDFVCRGYDTGKTSQLNPKRIYEDIDLSQFSTHISLANVTRLEDLNQMKKKDGILILFDPSLNTFGEEIKISITYMKAIDLTTEEEVTKEYSFWSNGNYFGCKLMKDFIGGRASGQQSPPHAGGGGGLLTPEGGMSSIPFLEGNRISLPGWGMKLPIFIPATKCHLEILDMEQYVKKASLVNNLTRLKFYAAFATGIKQGMKRIHEFLDKYLLQEAANSLLPGGTSALNYVCLHGNYEAVEKLIASGGSINNRCKADGHATPLHEAVLGRNVDVVMFLLENGANQVSFTFSFLFISFYLFDSILLLFSY